MSVFPSELESQLRHEIISGGAVQARTMEECLRSDDLSAKVLLVHHLLDHRLLAAGPDLERYGSFILSTLVRCFETDTEGTTLPTRFEVCNYLESYFYQLTHCEPLPLLAINAFVQQLGLLAIANPSGRDVIVLGFLEHIAAHRENVKLFSEWRRDSILSAMLRESQRLADQ